MQGSGRPDSPRAPDDLGPVHACFGLLLEGRTGEAQSLFPPDVLEAAGALIMADRSLESAGTPAPARRHSDAESLIGAEIAGFELLEFLGEGASGQVYRALQRVPERQVAFKLLWPCSRADALEQQREAAVLAPLEHPGIARLYQAGVWERSESCRPWLAMELVSGARPLDSASTAALAIPARVALLADVADAIAYAHSKGVIHRDLKPGNVLLDHAGSPKVIDFGLARHDGPARERSVALLGDRIVGSLASIAPECLNAGMRADTRSDVFSLGTIAYGVLAGQPMRALDGLSVAQAMRAITTLAVPRLAAAHSRLRGDLDRIVAKATDPDPSRRHASMALLARDLRDHLAGRPVLIEQQPLLERVTRFSRRHWRASAAVLAVALSLVSATAVSLDYAQQAREQAVLANLSVAASAIDACDLQTLDRAIEAIGDSSSPEVALLSRISALRGRLMSPADWYALAASPDGSWVVGSAGTGEAGDNAGVLVRWDGTSERWRISFPTAITSGVSISPDGRLISVCHVDDGVSIVDAERGAVLHRWSRGSGAEAKVAQFLPDGRLLYADTSACIVEIDGTAAGASFDPGVGLARAIRVLADGTAAIAGHGGAAIVDPHEGRVLRTLQCPPAYQTAVWADARGGSVLVSGWDRTVRAYAKDSSSPLWTGRLHRDLVWSIEGLGQGFAVSGGSDGVLAVWDVASGACTTMPGSPDMVWALLPTSSGMWIASRGGLRLQPPESVASWVGSAIDRRQFSKGPGWSAWIDSDGELRLVRDDGRPLSTGALAVRKVVLANGGGDTLCAVCEDGVLSCIDAASGELRWRSAIFLDEDGGESAGAERSGIASMSVNADEGMLLIASRIRGCVALDLDTGNLLWDRNLGQQCLSVGWARGGAIYAGGRQGLITRLDPSGAITREIRNQRRRAGAIIGDPTGTRVLVGGSDGTLRILDADTLEERIAIRVSSVRLESMWIDERGIWTIDQAGILRCR